MQRFRLYFYGFIVVAILVLAAYAYFTGAIPFVRSPLSAPAPKTGTPAAGTEGAASTGKNFTHGALSYTLSSVQRQPNLAPADATRAARGAFVIVSLVVRNNGKEPLTLSQNDFALVDREGRKFSVDVEAMKAFEKANKRDPFLGTAVQPGLANQGALVFDVAPEATGLTLRLLQGYLDVDLG